MAIIRFFETSIPNPGKKPPYRDGIRAEIVIDAKSSLHYEFPAMKAGETPQSVLERAPHEIRLNFAEQLLAYLNGNTGISGTRIETVSAITRAQCENLKACGIYTVEQLVAAPEPALEHLGAAGARLRAIGREYLESAGGGNDAAAMKAEIARLKAQNDALCDAIERADEKAAAPSGGSARRK